MSPTTLLLTLALTAGQPAQPKADPPNKAFTPPVGAFKLRSIGPALTSGRIVAMAVNPKDRAHYFLATVGGVEPRRRRAAERVHVVLDDDHLA